MRCSCVERGERWSTCCGVEVVRPVRDRAPPCCSARASGMTGTWTTSLSSRTASTCGGRKMMESQSGRKMEKFFGVSRSDVRPSGRRRCTRSTRTWCGWTTSQLRCCGRYDTKIRRWCRSERSFSTRPALIYKCWVGGRTLCTRASRDRWTRTLVCWYGHWLKRGGERRCSK